MIVSGTTEKIRINGMKQMHFFVKSPEKLMPFAKNPQIFPAILQCMGADNQDLVIEAVYLLVKALQTPNEDVSMELTNVLFTTTLSKVIQTNAFTMNMQQFRNGSEVQRLLFILFNNMIQSTILYCQFLESPLIDYLLAALR